KDPATYEDMMSYCSPIWVSDYTYLGVLNFRAGSPIGIIVPGPDNSGTSVDGLLVWERIINGQMTRDPAVRVPANANASSGGTHTWEARDGIGQVLASVNFDAPEVGDAPDRTVQMFSFVVPLRADVLAAIQTMHVKSGGQEIAQRAVVASSAADFENAVHMQ